MIKFEYLESPHERAFLIDLESATETLIEANGEDSIISVSHTVSFQGGTKFTALITYSVKD